MYMGFLYFSLCTGAQSICRTGRSCPVKMKSRAVREDGCQGVVRWKSFDRKRESEDKAVFHKGWCGEGSAASFSTRKTLSSDSKWTP
jgi:hypothetical protein